MDIQRAETHIGQVCLAARGALVISIGSIEVLIIWELVLRIKHFVGVHDLRAMVEVFDALLVLASVDLHHTSVKVVVLLVEDVLLVVICLFSLLGVCLVVAFVGTLRSV